MQVLTSLDEQAIARCLRADEFFWLDLVGPDHADVVGLGDVLGLHPAAVEDSREWGQLPKSDEYEDHVLLVFFSARVAEDGRAQPVEVHVYVSGRWIVTVRREPTRLDRLREHFHEQPLHDEQMVVYKVLDVLADGWDPVIDRLDARVDELEADVLERPREAQLTTIYRLRQEVSDLQRHAWRQSAVFPVAMERIGHLAGLTGGARAWLRDVNGHTESVTRDLRRLTGDLTALTDTFFNSNANRLNRLVTKVTVVSVFFLAWTLVTGFFGQNFRWLTDHIDSRGAFLGFGVGALVVPTVVLCALLYWRRRDWL